MENTQLPGTFKVLKHKTKPGVYGMAMLTEEDGEMLMRETPVPMVQPADCTMEGLVEAYKEGQYPSEEILRELEKYELVTVRLVTIKHIENAN